MGLMDAFKSLTQPVEEDDDFFEGADEQFRPAAPAQASEASAFENKFSAGAPAAPAPKKPSLFSGFNRQQQQQVAEAPVSQPYAEEDDGAQYDEPAPSGSLLGNFGMRRQQKAARSNNSFSGGDPQVTVFQPRSFEDVKKLVGYLKQGRSVFMNMEGMPIDTARRLLDVCTGVALALDGKVTPASGKTYFVTPIGVDIFIPTAEQEDVRIY